MTFVPIKSMHMKNLLCLLLLLLNLTALKSQGWEHLYPLNQYEQAQQWDMIPTPDAGMLINSKVEFNPPPHNVSSIHHDFIKIAANGEEQWRQPHTTVLGNPAVAMWPVENNHLLFVTLQNDTTRLVKTNANFQVIWSQELDAPSHLGHKTKLRKVDGGYVIVYQLNDAQSSPVRIIKTDLDGNLLWQQNYTMTGNFVYIDIVVDGPGNVYALGFTGTPAAAVVFKISPSGALLFTQSYPETTAGFSPIIVNDNLLAFLDFQKIFFIDSTGQLLNSIQVSIPPLFIYHMSATPDGNILLGNQSNVPSTLLKITPSGTVLWTRPLENALASYDKAPHVMWNMPGGGYAAFFISGAGNKPYYIARTDANGLVYTNELHGNIFADTNDDCNNTPGTDIPAPAVTVIAQDGSNYFYASTDSLGDYKLSLDTGTYLIRIVPPGGEWNVCSDSVTLSFGAYDTLELNSGLQSILDCPWPGVDISAPFLRRCFSSDYHLTYSNYSDVAADSATVTLSLDPLLSLQSASLPLTALANNNYSFYIGEIAPLETGSFRATVVVDCNAELGQTHCSSATISIANDCPPDPLPKPVVEVDATCEGDSVAFTIRNAGTVPMATEAGFIIIEDLIVMRQGQFQLPAQEETVIKCPANGNTARMYAGQAPGEPPFFAATSAIEGCNGPFLPGIWNMFPEVLERRQSTDRDCQPNIGSYDPNDKQAVPTGYGDEHYIGRGVGLNYKIRFQNTGTDTAFTVVVRDTLSQWLDASSIRPGAASHPYNLQIVGPGVLQFTFENILLPDSTTSLAGSQGYLSFEIEQQKDLPLETLIENRAGIYFDFNAAVMTNTTFHRVGEKFITLVDTWEPDRAGVLVKAIPNPADAETLLQVDGLPNSFPQHLQVFDLQGKMLQELNSETGVFQLKSSALKTGVYLFHISQNGQSVGRGKLMVQH